MEMAKDLNSSFEFSLILKEKSTDLFTAYPFSLTIQVPTFLEISLSNTSITSDEEIDRVKSENQNLGLNFSNYST
jgi:hypothetical protein